MGVKILTQELEKYFNRLKLKTQQFLRRFEMAYPEHPVSPFFRALIIATSVFLYACGGGGGGSSDGSSSSSGGSGDLSAAEIQNGANKAVAGSINNSLGDLGGIATNSGAIDQLLKAFGLDISQLRSSASAEQSDDPTEMIEQDIEDFLTALFESGNATETGDDQVTISYDTDKADALCATELSAELDPDVADCIDFFINLVIVIDATGADSGSIAISYSGFNLVTIAYSATSVSYTWDLNQLAGALEQIGSRAMSVAEKMRYLMAADDTVTLPEVIEGLIVLSYDETVPLTPKITLQNTTTIKVEDTAEGFDFSLAPSTWTELEFTPTTNNVSLRVDLGKLNATGPCDDPDGTEYSCMLFSERISWDWDLTNDGDLLSGSGTFGGSQPLYLDLTPVVGDPVREFDFLLEQAEFNVNSSGRVNHDMEFYMMENYENYSDILDDFFGDAPVTFGKVIDSGSEFQLGEDTFGQPAFGVISGQFEASRSGGGSSGSGSILATQGDCVAIDYEGSGFEYLPTDCLFDY